jgi:hypothetical protein
MSHPQSAAHYEPPPADVTPQPRRAPPPAVEAIAGWSARHRKTAVFGWLALVAVAYLIGQLLGSPSQPQKDLGQAGQAEQTLQHLGVTAPTTEAVLIQERSPGKRSRPIPRCAKPSARWRPRCPGCRAWLPGSAPRCGPAARRWSPATAAARWSPSMSPGGPRT